jgi:arylsulfatase A-like enzyme
MANYYKTIPDAKLSEVDLAHKKWLIAQEVSHEAKANLERAKIGQWRRANWDPHDRALNEDIAARVKEYDGQIRAIDANVERLWRSYVNLKPYVPNVLKEELFY